MKEQERTSACCSAKRTGVRLNLNQSEQKGKLVKSDEIKFKEKMIYLSGGEFLMGTNDSEGFPTDGEGPVRQVKVNPFYMDSHTVTNQEFAQFVKETGYKTESEQFGWSFVFYAFVSPNLRNIVQQVSGTPWWLAVKDAYWFQPEGPGSSIDGRMDHPVIQVSWNDAIAFCEWTGKRLPTEAEWEFAARGGLEQKKYPWGDELTPNGEHYCNIWQGEFPRKNTKEDGYFGTAPAKSFPSNGFGLYNMSGNVWEWCADWFSTSSSKKITENNHTSKVMRGGSYLCHESYCNRYRVAARSSNTIDSATGNMGFRCVANG